MGSGAVMKVRVRGIRALVLLAATGVWVAKQGVQDSAIRSACTAPLVPARRHIKSAPAWYSPYEPKNILTDDGRLWMSAAREVRNQAFVFELDLEAGQRVTKVEWKARDPDGWAPARLSLEVKTGEEWKHVAEFDSQMTRQWQAHAVSPSYRSKFWRLTFLRNHGSESHIEVRTVRFMVLSFRQRLWLDRPYPDVKVVSGNSSLPAHRAILAMASPVLATMLAEAQQTQQQEIRVEDVGKQSVQDFLEYLYTEDIAECADFGLVVLGFEYKVEMLAEQAAQQALKNLSPTNVVHALRLVRAYAKHEEIKPIWEALMNKALTKLTPENVVAVYNLLNPGERETLKKRVRENPLLLDAVIDLALDS